MFVPSYVPPPIEIPNNVSQERYAVRLQFIRATLHRFLIALMIVFLIAAAPPFGLPVRSTLAATLTLLVSMSIVRRLGKGRRLEVALSTGMLLPFLVSFGLTLNGLEGLNLPIGLFMLTFAMAWLYATTCGRDLSFIAMFFLPALVGSALWVVADAVGLVPGVYRWTMPALNVATLFYFVYDLSALLTRRRLGEEMGAVADLFRDLLNVFTYWARAFRYWKRYPLWTRSSTSDASTGKLS